MKKTKIAKIVLLIATLASLTACHRRARRVPVPPRPTIEARVGAVQNGIASWYGPPYHGRAAANGEIYDMEKFTAAHRTLPFETWVEVKNLANQKKVEVRITDRGPFIEGRVIDLSKAAARAIDLLTPGIGEVELKVTALGRREDPTNKVAVAAGGYGVQVGAFRDRARAEAVRADHARRFGSAILIYRDGAPPLWRVVAGRLPTLEDANALAAQIRLETAEGVFTVRLDSESPY